MGEDYDFCRLFVDGLGTAEDVEQALLNTGHYGIDRSDLGFVVGLDGPAGGTKDWLGWPVTMEVFRDEDDPVSDAAVLAVLRTLAGDLRAMGGQVKVAIDSNEPI